MGRLGTMNMDDGSLTEKQLTFLMHLLLIQAYDGGVEQLIMACCRAHGKAYQRHLGDLILPKNHHMHNKLVELFGDKYSVDGNHFYLRVAEQDDKPVRLQYHMFTIPDVGKAIEHLNNETDIRTMSSKPSTTPQGSLLQA